MTKSVLGVVLVTVLALVIAIPALAAVNVSAMGEVTLVDSVAETFQMQSDEGDDFEVVPPDGFDLYFLSVGYQVLVEGTLAGGAITAAIVVLLDEDADLSVVGAVSAIGAETFEITTEDGDIFMVTPPEDFDLSSMEIGDRVLVQGTLSGSEIAASNVVELPANEDNEHQNGPFAKDGYYCRTPEAFHPALDELAMAYDKPYSELLFYFCEWHFGVGEIKLALQSAMDLNNGMDFGDILEMKPELGGWGLAWQLLGLKGQQGGGPPPWAGGLGNGQGH